MLTYSGKVPDAAPTGNKKSPLPGLLKELSAGLYLILTLKMCGYYDAHRLNASTGPELCSRSASHMAPQHRQQTHGKGKPRRGGAVSTSLCGSRHRASNREGGEGVDSLPVSVDEFNQLSTSV